MDLKSSIAIRTIEKIMSRESKKSDKPEVLLFADSENDPDMLYFGSVFVPDPFIAFSCKGQRICVVSQLEFARVGSEGCFDQVILLEKLIRDSGIQAVTSYSFPASVIAYLAKEMGIGEFMVSGTFPCGPAFELGKLGVKLRVADGMLFPEREFKDDREAELIRKGNAACAAGFRAFEKLLRMAEIRRDFLYFQGRRLTSEHVQQVIAAACLERGAIAANTIVAGGNQACDPHCRGSGPLKANQFIIVDIFPRLTESGYHGDMTRTYLKGQASEQQKRLYATVFETQQWAVGEHRRGKSASLIYKAVMKSFTEKGFKTGMDNGRPTGFIHGLGHGLGLAVHEPPRVNASGTRLKTGQVITVEPGLYYPGLGGVRVEDVLRVRSGQPELLSKHGYRWHYRK